MEEPSGTCCYRLFAAPHRIEFQLPRMAEPSGTWFLAHLREILDEFQLPRMEDPSGTIDFTAAQIVVLVTFQLPRIKEPSGTWWLD